MFWAPLALSSLPEIFDIPQSIANRSLENEIFLGLLSDCSVLSGLAGWLAMSSITLRHRLTYRAENLNIASLQGSLGRFLTVFRNFAFLVSKFFLVLFDCLGLVKKTCEA